MNFDLIIKLAKLANNNPSENEANLAARKVCRLLAEGEFKFTNSTVPPTKPQPTNPKDNIYNDPIYTAYQTDWFYDFITKQKPEPKSKQPEPKPEPKSDHYYKRYYYYDEYEPAQTDKQQKTLKCRTCGKIVMTGFVGVPETFECYECCFRKFTKGL